MNLQQFITVAQESSFWQEASVYSFFYGEEEQFPVDVVAYIRTLAQKQGGLPVHVLQGTQPLSQIYAQLQTSFLGSSWCYSLSLAALDAKQVRELGQYLQSYTGPHKVLVFVARDYAEYFTKTQCIHLDDHVDEVGCFKLFASMGKTLSLSSQRLLKRLFKEQPRMPLTKVFSMSDYIALSGPSIETASATFDVEGAKEQVVLEELLLQQLRGMIKTETSLFTLSQLLFSKQADAFYRSWLLVKDLYPEQFWISFWSEQLYRAFFYVSYMKKGNQSEAQKIGTRLPFSFLQRDWRKHEPAALAAVHAQLYELDTALKNSRGELGFDRFYHNFFK